MFDSFLTFTNGLSNFTLNTPGGGRRKMFAVQNIIWTANRTMCARIVAYLGRRVNTIYINQYIHRRIQNLILNHFLSYLFLFYIIIITDNSTVNKKSVYIYIHDQMSKKCRKMVWVRT